MIQHSIITFSIIAITSITSIIAFPPNVSSINSIRRPEWFGQYLFNAVAVSKHKQYYRMLSYGFLHANWMHLFFNMFTLYFFAPIVETMFKAMFGRVGGLLFLLFYLSAIVVSTIADLIKYRNNSAYNAIGASGAVSAVLFAAILIYPDMKLMFLLVPIPITAWIFGLLYLGYSYYMAKRNIDNIGHSAHFWGAVYGFFLPILLQPKLLQHFFAAIFS